MFVAHMQINPKTKIIFSICIAIIIAFSSGIFFLYINWEPRLNPNTVEQFYFQDFPLNEKKIYLIGSSYVGTLNETRIQQNLMKYDKNIRLYNLAIPGDRLDKRLDSLSMILHSNPDIVVIGIDPAAFDLLVPQTQTRISDIGSDLHNFFLKTAKPTNDLLTEPFDFLENPRLVTAKTISNLKNQFLGMQETESEQLFVNKPFFVITRDLTVIRSDYELKSRQQSLSPWQIENKLNEKTIQQILVLKKIVEKLTKNNIKVILYVPPYHPYFHETVPPLLQDQFNQIMSDISNDLNVEIYSLYHKYGDLNIWYDLTHIAINSKGIIYSDDISKIIAHELGY